MPTITINTNVDRSIANKSFQEKLTNLTAEFYNFPIMVIILSYNYRYLFQRCFNFT